MADHLGSKSSIIPRIDRLNKYPIGLVETVISCARFLNSSLMRGPRGVTLSAGRSYSDELSRLTKNPAEELPGRCWRRWPTRGWVMDMPYGGEVYYLLLPGLIGFFEMTFMKMGRPAAGAIGAAAMRKYWRPASFSAARHRYCSLMYEEHRHLGGNHL